MGHRALVVEDDHALADVLRMKLVRDGHTVTVAKHQREAYRLLDQHRFEFVLLDLRLPTHKNDMDPNAEVGFAILDHIRDRFSMDELPVIVMTAYEETSQTAVRALKAFANDYIQKPFADSPVSLDDKLAGIIHHLQQDQSPSSGRGLAPSEKRHMIAFKSGYVEINGIRITCRHYDLLLVLGSKTLMRTPTATDNDGSASAMTGKAIATALKVEEPTVRQYVTRFRKRIADDHRRLKKGPIGAQDIIRNVRDWKGYALNFEKACIILE